MVYVGDWRSYTTSDGDFELPKYMYETLLNLMKSSLDMGVMVASDDAKLRAYKERIKHLFKNEWMNIAQALESLDLIIPCECDPHKYCKTCAGSRYIFNKTLSPDMMREVSTVIGTGNKPDIAAKLEKGLQKALEEIG